MVMTTIEARCGLGVPEDLASIYGDNDPKLGLMRDKYLKYGAYHLRALDRWPCQLNPNLIHYQLAIRLLELLERKVMIFTYF